MQLNGGSSAFRPLWTLALLLPALFSEVPTASASRQCAYTQLGGFSGTIEPGVGSNGQPLCDWEIFTGNFLEEIVLRPKVVRLQNTTTLIIWRLEETDGGQKSAFVPDKTYGHDDEVPEEIVYRGYHALRIIILDVNEDNVFEIEYTATAASLEAGTFSPTPLALAGMVAAVILSSVICTAALIYTLCLARAKWRRDEQAALAAVQHELAEQARREHEQKVQAALLQLPTETWRQEDQQAGRRSNAECCLCLEDFQDGEELKMLPCEHYFHSPCIDRWFSARRNMVRTCPLCKRDPLVDLIGRDLERGSARWPEARQDAGAEQGAAANARRPSSSRSSPRETAARAEDGGVAPPAPTPPPPGEEQQASTWAAPPPTPPQTAFGRSSVVYSV